MDHDIKAIDSRVKLAGFKELAYWAALILANVVCLTLMAVLLFH